MLQESKKKPNGSQIHLNAKKTPTYSTAAYRTEVFV